MTLPTLPPPDMVHVDAQGYSTPCYTSESMQQYALAALREQPADNDEYVQGYKNGVKREAEIWRERLDAERQRSVHIEAMNRKLLEQLAKGEALRPPSMILMAAQPNHSELITYLRELCCTCGAKAADALEGKAIGETK